MVADKAIIKPDTSLNNLVKIAGAAVNDWMATGFTEPHAIRAITMWATFLMPIRDVALAWEFNLVKLPQIQ